MGGKDKSRKAVPSAGGNPLREAQDLIYDAWEMADLKSCLALARRALKISPDCADAYVLLAEAARTRAKALELYRKGVEAGDARWAGRPSSAMRVTSGASSKPKREVRRILVQQQLADLRERRGLSQAQLAEAIGVSQPRIAQIEKGRIEGFRIQTLMRVADALGADLKIVLMRAQST